MFPVFVKAHYLDASALVKLVADDSHEERGRDVLRKYYREHSNMYATSYCVTETFSAFKLKFLRGQIAENQYITGDRELAKAARAEGASVWECTSEPAPV